LAGMVTKPGACVVGALVRWGAHVRVCSCPGGNVQGANVLPSVTSVFTQT